MTDTTITIYILANYLRNKYGHDTKVYKRVNPKA